MELLGRRSGGRSETRCLRYAHVSGVCVSWFHKDGYKNVDKKVEDSEAEEGKGRQAHTHTREHAHTCAHMHARACQLITNSKSVLSTFVSI